MLYAAAWRAARAMGYHKLIAYILDTESGTSLRAAGWKCVGQAGGLRWTRIVEQDGYTGKNYFSVVYGAQTVTVHAADTLAALFVAAKHWGYKFSHPEYHQNAKAYKLHSKPDFFG